MGENMDSTAWKNMETFWKNTWDQTYHGHFSQIYHKALKIKYHSTLYDIYIEGMCAKWLQCVWLFATLWTVAHEAPLSSVSGDLAFYCSTHFADFSCLVVMYGEPQAQRGIHMPKQPTQYCGCLKSEANI